MAGVICLPRPVRSVRAARQLIGRVLSLSVIQVPVGMQSHQVRPKPAFLLASVPAHGHACSAISWSAPTPLLGDSLSMTPIARSPSIVGDETHLFVVGNNVPFFDQEVRIGTTLTAWRVGYGSIGAPSSDFVFASPKAVLDASGRLHILWAEPERHGLTIGRYQWQLLQAASIWTAAYDPRAGWSAPLRIHSGPVVWNRVSSGDIYRGRRGELLVAIPTPSDSVLLVSFEEGKWRTTTVIANGVAAYTAVASIGGKPLLIVVAGDKSQAHDVNSIFLLHQDEGRQWRRWKQLQRSGENGAFEVRLVTDGERGLHMVWRQALGGSLSVVRHILSTDGGQSWSAATDLLPGSVIQNLQVAVDRCGRVHVAYEDWAHGPNSVRLGSAIWDHGWSRPTTLYSGFFAIDPEFSVRPNKTLMLAFLGAPRPSVGRVTLALFASELR